MGMILETENISKTFPGSMAAANSGIEFSLAENEIHAVVGENGSGKSTFMHIISGLIKPDTGRIIHRGREVTLRSPRDAINLGIGMIHQVPGTVPGFSVLENVMLGSCERCFGTIDRKGILEKLEKISGFYGIEIDPNSVPGSTGSRQITVLLALIHRDAEIIIFDEPTASLSDSQTGDFFRILEKLHENGKTLIMVTHRIQTALTVSDRITVLSKGKNKGTLQSGSTDVDAIADLITGESRGRFNLDKKERKRPAGSKVVFEARGIVLPGPGTGSGRPQINFAVHEGEILTFTGIRDRNLDMLENLLSGFLTPEEGSFIYLGKEITGSPIRSLRKSGIKYIPSDRLGRGTSLTTTVENNLAFTHIGDFSEKGFINSSKVRAFFNTGRWAFAINAVPGQPLWQLSGGNIQKVILFREMHKAKNLLIFCEPAWNLDIRSRKLIYDTILDLKNSGTSIIMISTDMDEVIDLSDRTAVMYQGKIAGFLEGEEINSYNIGRLMLGIPAATGRGENPDSKRGS